MAKEKEPLHEWILRLVYLEHPEKPEPMSTEDILWKIDDPTVSLHNVKEVLDWLVRKNDMEVRFGKYQLDRIKYLELREQNQHLAKEAVPVVNYYNINNKNEKKKKPKKQKQKIILAPAVTPTLEDSSSRKLIDAPSDNHNKKWYISAFIVLAFLLGFYALNQLELSDGNENNIALFSLNEKEDIIKNDKGIGGIRSLKDNEDINEQINQKIGLINKQMKHLLDGVNNKDHEIKQHNNLAFIHLNGELELMKKENEKLWITLLFMFSFLIILLLYFIFKKK